MHKIVFILLLTLSLSFGISAQTKVTSEEYTVFAIVLKDIYKYNRETYSNKSHFVILNETKIDAEMLNLVSSKKYKNLVGNFKVKNTISETIEEKLPQDTYSETYYLIAQNELDELFEKGEVEFKRRYEIDKLNKSIVNPGGTAYWMPFYEKYPEASGYYNLSRVGFSGIFALVQVQREDISRGFSRNYLLKKVKGKWRIINFSGSESVAKLFKTTPHRTIQWT